MLKYGAVHKLVRNIMTVLSQIWSSETELLFQLVSKETTIKAAQELIKHRRMQAIGGFISNLHYCSKATGHCTESLC